MKIFGWEIKKKAENDVDDPRMRSVLLPGFTYNNQIPTPEDFARLVNFYSSWVYVCANKNANAIAEVPLRLYGVKKNSNQKFIVKTKAIDTMTRKRLEKNSGLVKYLSGSTDVEEILEHPLLDMLKSVNPLMNRFDLWEITQIFLELTGNAYWYIVKDALGTPNQLWPIQPQYMQIVTSKETIVHGYVFRYGTQLVPFNYDEIIHFRFMSPTSQLYGMGPLAAVIDTVAIDKNMRKFENALLEAGGRPDGVLETKENLSDKEFDRLREQWIQRYGGASKSGKTLILEKGLTYKPLSLSPKEMNYLIGRKMNREEIAAIFGVPMSKLTSESINRANAEAGEKQYATDTKEPRLRRLEEKINERLIPMYEDGENMFVAYDSSIPDDIEFELRDRTARLGSYITTINEERSKLGMESVEWGDKPIAPMGIGELGAQPTQPEQPLFLPKQIKE